MSVTFRPRAIDQDKELPIIRDVRDLDDDGGAFVTRAAPDVPTGMDLEDEKEVHVRRAMEGQFRGDKKKKKVENDIPTPEVRHVPSWEQYTPADFKRPAGYIHYTEPNWDDPHCRIEYDMDSEDEKWLNTFNSQNVGKPLTADHFEVIFDRLEKATNFNKELIESVELPNRVGDKAFKALREHWVMRRLTRGTPLNIRFRPPPEYNDSNPMTAFRPRERTYSRRQRGNDQSAYMKLTRLRREFERTRNILELMKKREKIKRELVAVRREIFDRLLLEDKNPALFSLVWSVDDLPSRDRKKRRLSTRFYSDFDSEIAEPEPGSESASEISEEIDGDADSVLGTLSDESDEEMEWTTALNVAGVGLGYTQNTAMITPSPMEMVAPPFVEHVFGGPLLYHHPPRAPHAGDLVASTTTTTEEAPKPASDMAFLNTAPRSGAPHVNSAGGLFRFRGRPRFARGGRIVYDRVTRDNNSYTPSIRGVSAAAQVRRQGRANGEINATDPFGLCRLAAVAPRRDSFAEFKKFLKSIPLSGDAIGAVAPPSAAIV